MGVERRRGTDAPDIETLRPGRRVEPLRRIPWRSGAGQPALRRRSFRRPFHQRSTKRCAPTKGQTCPGSRRVAVPSIARAAAAFQPARPRPLVPRRKRSISADQVPSPVPPLLVVTGSRDALNVLPEVVSFDDRRSVSRAGSGAPRCPRPGQLTVGDLSAPRVACPERAKSSSRAPPFAYALPRNGAPCGEVAECRDPGRPRPSKLERGHERPTARGLRPRPVQRRSRRVRKTRAMPSVGPRIGTCACAGTAAWIAPRVLSTLTTRSPSRAEPR